jgi:uncharacterized protein YjlB
MDIAQPEILFFQDDGVIPNSTLPLLLYRRTPLFDPEELEQRFAGHNWRNSWRSGIYYYHHYHSNTHEVLAVISGQASLQLGGEMGRELQVGTGDVMVIPAGVGHKCLTHSKNFQVLGAYPDGLEPDLRKNTKAARIGADANIRSAALPDTDPLYGKSAGLVHIWNYIPQA